MASAWREHGLDPDTIRERYLWVGRNEAAPTLSVGIAHGGAGAAVWIDALARGPQDAHLVAIRLPGRESRITEPLSMEVEPLGAETASTIASLLGERRLVLVGVCYGAAVAHAATRYLHEIFGIRPTAFIAVDCAFGSKGKPAALDMHDPAFTRYVRVERLLPDWVWSEPVLTEMLLEQLQADMSAHATYQWPERVTPAADSVIAVTGRRMDAATAAGWAGVADRIQVIDGGTYAHNMLVDDPVRLGQIINSVANDARDGMSRRKLSRTGGTRR
jgi:medium-chain acyl-[acyl-carrier-protein] hydrolase